MNEEIFICLPEDLREIEGEVPDEEEATRPGPLTFRSRGPFPLRHTEPTERTTSDEEVFTTEWEYPVFIGVLQHNASREQVAEWITWVAQHSQCWVRAGIWIPLVSSPDAAIATIRYVEEPLNCGGVSPAAGCTQQRAGPSGTTLIRMARGRLRSPTAPDGLWKGVAHELFHAIAGANHGGKGVMQGTPQGTWPSQSDVDALIAFTQGRGPSR